MFFGYYNLPVSDAGQVARTVVASLTLDADLLHLGLFVHVHAGAVVRGWTVVGVLAA